MVVGYIQRISMKTSTKIICIVAAVALVAMPQMAVAMRSSPDAEFERAMKKGAQARLEIRVVDDEGAPVSNATVKVLFNMLTPGGGEIVTVTTDTNGVAVAEGKTNDAIRYRVEKEGYYKSEEGMDMYNMSHRCEVKGGRWQPWGMQKEIVLRPVRNPAAIRMPVNNWRYVKDMYKWIGFDLQKYDFLPPHGKGEFADLELRIDWNGKRFKGYEGIDEHIRFPNKYSGAYYVDRSMQSDFKDVYVADSNAVYQTEFDFYEHPVYDKKGMTTRRDTKELGSSRALVVRSRCKTDDEGNLVSANYFLLSDLQFGGSDKGACLIYQGVYNPTPNDTNLEPK